MACGVQAEGCAAGAGEEVEDGHADTAGAIREPV